MPRAGTHHDDGPLQPRAMQNLNTRQFDFAAAILNPELPVPDGLVGPDGEPSIKRFAVYRNNVVAGLIEALKAAFPAVQRIVGDEFFAAMARIYVAQHPPASPIMLHYGAGFADFIAAFEPAAELPYLSDVARIERGWAEAYHAAERRPLDPAVFMTIAPDDMAHIHFDLHPSVRVVRSRYPAVTIWHMNIDGGTPASIDLNAGGEDALIARPFAEVEVRPLPPGGAVFLQTLLAGSSITTATTAAMRTDDGFDLAGNIRGLIEAGVFVGYSILPTYRQNQRSRHDDLR